MPLPKIATPTYELELPSTGETVQYRPFLVKEEKLLVIALESDDTKQITTAIKTVIKNCVITKGIKVEQLPTFDIEYLFLRIRAKSVGEVSEFKVIAPDDNETQVEVEVNLEEVEVVVPKEHTNKIKITDEVTLVMKYPSIDTFVKNNLADDPKLDDIFQLAADCVDQIANGEEVENAKAYKKGELVSFFETMNNMQF